MQDSGAGTRVITSKSASGGRFFSLGVGGTSLDAPESHGAAANKVKAFLIILSGNFLSRFAERYDDEEFFFKAWNSACNSF